MENKDENTLSKDNKWTGIVITQGILVAIILISLVLMKYFWKDTFNSVKNWYFINICNDTDVNEVLTLGDDNNEIQTFRH